MTKTKQRTDKQCFLIYRVIVTYRALNINTPSHIPSLWRISTMLNSTRTASIKITYSSRTQRDSNMWPLYLSHIIQRMRVVRTQLNNKYILGGIMFMISDRGFSMQCSWNYTPDMAALRRVVPYLQLYLHLCALTMFGPVHEILVSTSSARAR